MGKHASRRNRRDAAEFLPLADDVVAKMTRAQYGLKLGRNICSRSSIRREVRIIKEPVDAKTLIFQDL